MIKGNWKPSRPAVTVALVETSQSRIGKPDSPDRGIADPAIAERLATSRRG